MQTVVVGPADERIVGAVRLKDMQGGATLTMAVDERTKAFLVRVRKDPVLSQLSLRTVRPTTCCCHVA